MCPGISRQGQVWSGAVCRPLYKGCKSTPPGTTTGTYQDLTSLEEMRDGISHTFPPVGAQAWPQSLGRGGQWPPKLKADVLPFDQQLFTKLSDGQKDKYALNRHENAECSTSATATRKEPGCPGAGMGRATVMENDTASGNEARIWDDV